MSSWLVTSSELQIVVLVFTTSFLFCVRGGSKSLLLSNLLDTHLPVYSFDDSIFPNVPLLLKSLYIHDLATIVIGAGMGWGMQCNVYQTVPVWPWYDHVTSTGILFPKMFHALHCVDRF